MKIIAILMLSLLASTETSLQKFINEPSDRALYQLRLACSNHPLHIGKVESEVRKLMHLEPTLTTVRALILIRARCGADGALAEDLNSTLGKDLLQSHPALLISALAREPQPDPLFGDIAYASGPSGDSLFTDCDATCLPKIDEFYDSKISALKNLELKGLEKNIRDRLISEIEKVKRDWQGNLKAPESPLPHTETNSP